MLLTDHARTHCSKWLIDTQKYHTLFSVVELNNIPDVIINFLIIDFFDSVGIYIETGGICHVKGHPDFHYNIQENNTLNGINGFYFEDRQKAQAYAITEANNIYNKRYDTVE